METLRVHNIQRFCLHDGPGIRTTVFLQGCSLRCWWCHNPNSRPIDDPAATVWSLPALAKEIERDARFWRASGGGVTLSGGEPLLQAEGVEAFMTLLGRGGHHRVIQTAGCVALAKVQAVAPQVDLWLWDIKSVDAQTFRSGTGGSVNQTLDNLLWVLNATATPVRVRVPVIAGFNDAPTEARRIADWLAALPRPVDIELLQGHDLGRDPSASAVKSARLADPQFTAVRQTMRDRGLTLLDIPS